MDDLTRDRNVRMMPRFNSPNESPIRLLVDLVCGKVPLLLFEREGDKVGRFVAARKSYPVEVHKQPQRRGTRLMTNLLGRRRIVVNQFHITELLRCRFRNHYRNQLVRPFQADKESEVVLPIRTGLKDLPGNSPIF